MSNSYYKLVATAPCGTVEVIFGSFDRGDVVFEKEAEKDSLKAEGYKKLTIITEQVEEKPDTEVYGIPADSGLDKYASEDEQRIARDLITAALDKGFNITVHDEEETLLSNSNNVVDILNELCHSDLNVIDILEVSGRNVGVFQLIWGNDDCVISDHSANNICTSLATEAGA